LPPPSPPPANTSGSACSASPNEATRAYDAAAWRFARGRSELNFLEVKSAEEARFLAPPPLLETRKERCIHDRVMQQISITEADE
jgi:hypothetical protein